MPKGKRIVYPGVPHHVIQRGTRREKTFFDEDDYLDYLRLLEKELEKVEIDIWAYCLMPNHVHFVVVPKKQNSLSLFFGQLHRKYSLRINARRAWKGYLWQGRFSSFPMNNDHATHAIRYVENNPVRARLVKHPGDWAWSSAPFHLGKAHSSFLTTNLQKQMRVDWGRFLGLPSASENEAFKTLFRQHARNGEPLGLKNGASAKAS